MTRVIQTFDFENYGVILVYSPKTHPEKPFVVTWIHRGTAAQHAEEFRTEREAERRIELIEKSGGWRWPFKSADWL